MLCLPQYAVAQVRHFDVPAQAASNGVRQLARQAGIQVVLAGSNARGRRTNAIKGALTTTTALDRLLARTGLIVRSFDGTLAVLDVETRPIVERPPDPIIVTKRFALAARAPMKR